MYDIKAIETEYNGVLFRSRLEARWAVFFDQLNITWMYEYEGYQTPTEYYVPDFWLPEVYLRENAKGCFIEVKPDNYESDMHPALEFISQQLNVGGILVKGFYPDDLLGDDSIVQIGPWWDIPMMLYRCTKCKKFKFEFPESSYDDCPHCKFEGSLVDGAKTVLEAREYALAYRFW
jgi:hypothetical protein